MIFFVNLLMTIKTCNNQIKGKQNAEWQRPMGEMDLNTNYNTEFTPKPTQRVQAIRPSSRRLIDAKFDGDTTYGQDFRKWPGERRDLIRNPNEYTPSNAPFDGLSTYKGNNTKCEKSLIF